MSSAAASQPSGPVYYPALYERVEVAGLAEEGFFGSECTAVVGELPSAGGPSAAAEQQGPRVVYDEVRMRLVPLRAEALTVGADVNDHPCASPPLARRGGARARA
jgi:hypothetical protein